MKKSLKSIKKEIAQSSLINCLVQKNLKGGIGGNSCPPPCCHDITGNGNGLLP